MAPLLSTTLLRAQTDRRLVELVHAGHEPAFTAIVERYRAQLHRYCLRILPEGRCDDALQQAFLQAWRALRDGRTVHQLRPWLYAIVHNAAVTQLRQGVFDYAELLDTVQGTDDPEADFERRSIMRQTLAAVAALPERQRAALLAVVLEGRPQAQVALEMGLTENGLRQLLFRARTSLRGAATALTPMPLLVWAMRTGTGTLGGRAGEVAAGSAAVAGGAHALQTGTALVVAGSIALGGTAALEHTAVERHAARNAPVAVVRAGPEAAPVPLRTVARRVHVRRQHSASAGGASGSAAARRALPAVRHVAILVNERTELRPVHTAPAAAPPEAAPPVSPQPAQTAVLAPAPAETVTPDAAPAAAPPPAAGPAPDPALSPQRDESGPGGGGGDQRPSDDGHADNSGPGNQSDGGQPQGNSGGPGPSDGGGDRSGSGSSEPHQGQG